MAMCCKSNISLPVMCHNLRDDGRGPPATVFTTPGLLQR